MGEGGWGEKLNDSGADIGAVIGSGGGCAARARAEAGCSGFHHRSLARAARRAPTPGVLAPARALLRGGLALDFKSPSLKRNRHMTVPHLRCSMATG